MSSTEGNCLTVVNRTADARIHSTNGNLNDSGEFHCLPLGLVLEQSLRVPASLIFLDDRTAAFLCVSVFHLLDYFTWAARFLRLKGTAYIKHQGRADKGHSGSLTCVLPTRRPHGTIDGRARGTCFLRVVPSLDPWSDGRDWSCQGVARRLCLHVHSHPITLLAGPSGRYLRLTRNT